MKISGFTIIRNAIINDYPVTESIRSILPVVDEMIVAVGGGEDATRDLILSIGSEKIKIVDTEWDMSLRKGGQVLAVETDKAFQQVAGDADWAFYIQGDEVVHEQYHAAIRNGAERWLNDKRVEGLLFNYLHFYGTYNYVGDSRRWYNREVRVIRNDKSIRAYKDAQGFRRNGEKLRVKPIDASVYHYGWVKSPKSMFEKQKNVSRFWHQTEEDWHNLQREDFYDFSNLYDSLQQFTGTHPAVMAERIQRQNWDIRLDTGIKRFTLKERLLYLFEKKTGRRLFDFQNYRVI